LYETKKSIKEMKPCEDVMKIPSVWCMRSISACHVPDYFPIRKEAEGR
jgi:hypothetical protein